GRDNRPYPAGGTELPVLIDSHFSRLAISRRLEHGDGAPWLQLSAAVNGGRLTAVADKHFQVIGGTSLGVLPKRPAALEHRPLACAHSGDSLRYIPQRVGTP